MTVLKFLKSIFVSLPTDLACDLVKRTVSLLHLRMWREMTHDERLEVIQAGSDVHDGVSGDNRVFWAMLKKMYEVKRKSKSVS